MADMPPDWAVGAIDLKMFRPGEPPETIPVAGWVKGPFGLDFRVWDDSDGEPYAAGWNLTHIPTGYAICGIWASLADAQAVADEISEIGSWDFADPDCARALGKAFHAFRDRYPDTITRAAHRLAPSSLEPKRGMELARTEGEG